LTVDGILARDAITAQVHDLALALGRAMRPDGTFETLRAHEVPLCVEVRPVHRDRVLALTGTSSWSWGDYRRGWIAAGLAHQCPDLPRGSVRLFLEQTAVCPVPWCRGALVPATVEGGRRQRSTWSRATESVPETGDASGDEEGDAWAAGAERSDEEALDSLRRILGASPLPEPISDDDVRALGFEPTDAGWRPRDVTDVA
jgi:hypothetical protein